MQGLVVLVVLDILWVAASTITVGFIAPRVPARLFERDAGPLHMWPWESSAFYRRLGAPRLARALPEAGAAFGGESKSALPGSDVGAMKDYLGEVRRAEWVHWLSSLCSLALFLFNPWWLALAFVVAVGVVNAAFIVILRHNRLRIRRIMDRSGA